MRYDVYPEVTGKMAGVSTVAKSQFVMRTLMLLVYSNFKNVASFGFQAKAVILN